MLIHETNDYNRFKHLKGNRPIEIANLKKIMITLQHNNLLYLHPIIVNENYEIIDGQHRLKACQVLKIPVSYTISKGLTLKDAIDLNGAQSSWTFLKYLNSFCELGNTSYIKFRDTFKEYKISATLIIDTINSVSEYWKDHEKYQKFKSGHLIYDDELKKKVEIILDEMNLLKPYFDNTIRQDLGRAYLRVKKSKEFDSDIFFRKIKIYPRDKIYVQSTETKHVRLFEEIYNYKNRHQIRFI